MKDNGRFNEAKKGENVGASRYSINYSAEIIGVFVILLITVMWLIK